MSKYNLSTLASKLSPKTGLTQTEAELFIRKMFDVVNQGLETDKQVKMRWLGTFKVTTVKERESVDVNTGERIVIEGRDKISFSPDNILKEIVNKPFAQFETVVVADGVEFDDIDRKFDAVIADEQDDEQKVIEQQGGEQQGDEQQCVEQQGDEQVLENVSQEESLSGNEVTLVPDLSETNRVSSVLKGVSADLNESVESSTDTSIDSLANPPVKSSVHSVLSSSEETNDVQVLPSGVVDFLNMPSDKKTDSDVVVVGEDKLADAASEDEPVIETAVEEPQTENIDTDKDSRIAYLENKNEVLEEEEEELRRRHFIIPKYLVVSAILLILVMIGGFAWFAFNYGKMAAQRDHLAMQLDRYQVKAAQAKAAPKPKLVDSDAQEERLREKAHQDSLRMVQASEAIKAAENADKSQGNDEQSNQLSLVEKSKQMQVNADKADKSAKAKESNQDKKLSDRVKTEKENIKNKQELSKIANTAKYDGDVRVRTGAYRIVGVAQIVKVGPGQTLAAISNRYLGAGMECYVEALNGTSSVKPGQSVKIPKLELKKKTK